MVTDTSENTRNYGLDLLKIICMFGILGFHFTDLGAVELRATLPLAFNWMVLAFWGLWGGVSNCVFMLISGYFLVNKTFKLKSIVRLYGQVWFFSVLTGVLAYTSGTMSLTYDSMLSVIFPITHDVYWYFTSYVVVYLIFPYINIVIDRLTKRQHRNLVLCGIVIVTCIHLARHSLWIMFDNQIPLFIVMYLAGAYIRRYDLSLPRRRAIVYTMLCLVVGMFSVVLMRWIYPDSDSFEDVLLCVYNSSRLFPIVTGIVLFLLFKDIMIGGKSVHLVYFFSSSTFGVYLLSLGHLKEYLYKVVLNDSGMYETPYLILFLAVGMVAMFMAGILVDKLRICVLERLLLSGLSASIERADRKIASLYPER